MDKLKKAIQQIGQDIGVLQGQLTSFLSVSRAYELFPTYSTLQDRMTTDIKEKHIELGLDALIDDKLKTVVIRLSRNQNCQRLTQVNLLPKTILKS